jgi:recombination protein RecA
MAKKRRNCMNPNAARITTLGFRPDAKIRECLPTGIASLDAMFSNGDALLTQGQTQGFPRGAISEILGPESSGRTTLVHSLLAASTAQLEICAYVDTDDSFDPVSAAAAGVALSQLVWIRCGHNAGHALKAADYLLHAGGFGAIVLDLCQVPPRISNRIPISYWYRFRRAIENTPTILALVEKQPLAKSCASLMLDMHCKKANWKGAPGFELLRGVELEALSRKPVRPATAAFKASAIL